MDAAHDWRRTRLGDTPRRRGGGWRHTAATWDQVHERIGEDELAVRLDVSDLVAGITGVERGVDGIPSAVVELFRADEQQASESVRPSTAWASSVGLAPPASPADHLQRSERLNPFSHFAAKLTVNVEDDADTDLHHPRGHEHRPPEQHGPPGTEDRRRWLSALDGMSTFWADPPPSRRPPLGCRGCAVPSAPQDVGAERV